MGHKHPVIDGDKHFIIDPVTRAITNAESKKNTLIQNDHNSEQFSFEIDRYVEGHDLTLCNRVEIHYTDVESTKRATSVGIYEVTDLKISSEDSSKIVFTWLVSENATMYAGSLTFLILFECIEDGKSVYRWNTAPNNSISIARGMYNGDVVIEAFPDVFTQMREELLAAVYGYKKLTVGVNEPLTYPYLWFDTSQYTTQDMQGVGLLKAKDENQIPYTMYPVTKMEAIIGLKEKLESMTKLKATYEAAIETLFL